MAASRRSIGCPQCGSCANFDGVLLGRGFCRAKAPALNDRSERGYCWPIVDPEADWCRESFAPKSEYRICANCGAEFRLADRRHRRYCSTTCRGTANTRRMRARQRERVGDG